MTALPEAKAWCLDCCLPPGAADDYCGRCGGDNLAWIPASHLAPPMTEGDEAQAAPLPEGEAEQAMPQPERGAHAAPLPEEQVRWLLLPRQTSIRQVSDGWALLSVPEQAEMTTWLPGLLPGLRPTEEGAQLPACLPAEIDQGRGRDPARQGGKPEQYSSGTMPLPEPEAHAAPLPEELVRCMPVPAGMTSILQLTDVSTHRTARAHMLGDRRQNSISHDRADSQIE